MRARARRETRAPQDLVEAGDRAAVDAEHAPARIRHRLRLPGDALPGRIEARLPEGLPAPG